MREYHITEREHISDPDPITLTLYSFREVARHITLVRHSSAKWGMPAPVITVMSTPGR